MPILAFRKTAARWVYWMPKHPTNFTGLSKKNGLQGHETQDYHLGSVINVLLLN